MIVVVPPATPVTIPEPDATVATEGLVLVHVPPVSTSVSVMVDPAQTGELPVIAGVDVFTVTTEVVKQPVVMV